MTSTGLRAAPSIPSDTLIGPPYRPITQRLRCVDPACRILAALSFEDDRVLLGASGSDVCHAGGPHPANPSSACVAAGSGGGPAGDCADPADMFSRELENATPRLRRYAWRLSGNRDTADDLVQDTLMRAWRARASFEQGSNLQAWTRKILRNVFLTSIHRDRHFVDPEHLTVERQLMVAEQQSHHVELGDVAKLIDRLPVAQREALVLVAIDGLAYDEAAARIGISLGTLKSRVSRGRIALRAMMESIGESTRPVVPAHPTSTPLSRLRVMPRADRRAILIGA